MKVYVVYQLGYTGTNQLEILGVYKNIRWAEEKYFQTIADNVAEFDFGFDKECNDIVTETTRMTRLFKLSNDGDFIYQVTHPKHEINKTYQVTVKGKITNEEVENLRNGVDIGGYITKPAQVRIMKVDEEKNISRIEITIHEGKNRQVRRMCEAIGKKVLALHRSKIGDIGVKDLKLGEFRYLTNKEVKQILT